MTNKQIARLFRQVAAAYTIKNEGKFRFQIIAYERAADAIENSTEEIIDLFKQGENIVLPGIGPAIHAHLEELLKTGKVKHFDWVMSGISQAMFPLLDIPTLGPKKAYRLAKEFNLTKSETVIDDLEKIAKQGKIAKLEGFGEKSEQDILRAISEYRQGKGKTTRMILPYAFELAETMIAYLKKAKATIEAYPLGSLRRMASTVGDIDIAVATNNPKAVIAHFAAYPNSARIIEQGPTTASMLVSSGHQIDLMTQPKESFGSLLQHFTGSKNHNIKLREYALKKGMSLSEYGIKRRSGQMAKYPTEEEFYNALGMDWIVPELREDQGEIEAALRPIRQVFDSEVAQTRGAQGKQAQGKPGGLPNLVKLQDIKGDFHLHSNYPIKNPSHAPGMNSIEEMMKKGKDLGYEYVGISDHPPGFTSVSQKEIIEWVKKRTKFIQSLNESTKSIRILNGLEVDILGDGSLPIPDEALATLDYCIAGIHSGHRGSKEQITKRLITALQNPHVDIISHPTNRLLNERESSEADWKTIFKAAAATHKLLEISAHPIRLDLRDDLVYRALKYGVKFIINTDAHEVSPMDNMFFGVSVARRGWATQNDIANTWDWTKLKKWFKINP